MTLSARDTCHLEAPAVKKAVSARLFRTSMSRRFAVLSDKFLVHLNGEPLTKEAMDFQFRFPEDGGLGASDIEGAGTIRWGVGFTKIPIPDDEARGFRVVEGKARSGALLLRPIRRCPRAARHAVHDRRGAGDFLDDAV